MRWALLFFLFIGTCRSWAQTNSTTPFFQQKVAFYQQQIQNAPTDSARIVAMGQLAEFYFIYRAETMGDSVMQQQLLQAELSNNKNLVLYALFGEGLKNITDWANMETFDKAIAFADKGLVYARQQGQKEYETIARLRKAMLYRKRGHFDFALQETARVFPLLQYIKSDSLKAAWYIEVGDIFLARGNVVDAYMQYNSAYDIAYSIKNPYLQSQVYHHLSQLYMSVNDAANARKNLDNSLTLNLANGNKRGLMADYFNLARLTDQKDYVVQLARLADTLQSEKYKLLSKRLMFALLMVKEKQSTATLQYLHSNPDLKQSILNTGSANYLWNIGNVYRYSEQPDSAIFYYSRAEPEMQRSFDASVRNMMSKEIGECYLQLGNSEQAILYFEKAFTLGKQVASLDSNAVLAQKLSLLYAQAGNYQKAYDYNQHFIVYKDTLESLANARSLVHLELEREEGKHEKDLADLKARELRKHNLQYMGISLGIVAFFTLLILLGMFKVSKLTVRILGFFAFICLFEFFIVMIDAYLHHATHGEPLKIWLAKIFIIALLLPLHHFLEHKAVQFLESQKLLQMRQRFSVAKIWGRKKIVTAPEAAVVVETPAAN